MPRTCTVCRSERREEVDRALVERTPYRNIAKRCSVSIAALHRHRPHVGAAIVRAAERKEERREESLLEKVERLEADARRLGEKAEKEGDFRCAIAAVKELLDVVKLMHELRPPERWSPARWREWADEMELRSDDETRQWLRDGGVPEDVIRKVMCEPAERGCTAGAPVAVKEPEPPAPEPAASKP